MPKTKGNIKVNIKRKYRVKFRVPNKEKSRRKTGKKKQEYLGNREADKIKRAREVISGKNSKFDCGFEADDFSIFGRLIFELFRVGYFFYPKNSVRFF